MKNEKTLNNQTTTNANANAVATKKEDTTKKEQKQLANATHCIYPYFNSKDKKVERETIKNWIDNKINASVKNANGDANATRRVTITNDDAEYIDLIITHFASELLAKRVNDSGLNLSDFKIKQIVSTAICNISTIKHEKIDKKQAYILENLDQSIKSKYWDIVKNILVNIAKLVKM